MASEANADYRVKLTEAYLKIRKVKVSPSISIAHELALKKGLAIYPLRRMECKTFIISAGNPMFLMDSCRKRLSSELSTVEHSTAATRKILTTLKPIPPRSSESPSMDKYSSNPYSSPIQTRIPDISRLISPCSPVPECWQ